MTSPTHIAFSGFLWFFISGILAIPLNLFWGFVCCVASLLPDIDCGNSWIGRVLFFISGRIEKSFGHRTVTHSFLGMVIFGIALSPILIFSPTLFSALLIGYASHIFLDCMNKNGVALFYPEGVQAVMPGREEFRFIYGGKGERVLLFGFIGLGLLMYPIANKGVIKSIHYLRGDPEAAVSDFRDYAQNNVVWCDLKGIDALTNRPVQGRFRVIGAEGSTTLIISNEGHLRTVGTNVGVNIRAIKTRCRKGEEISVVVNEVDIREKYLGIIKAYIDISKEHYLFGILDLEKRPSIKERIERYKTVGYENNKMVLGYANWDELEKLSIEDVFVKEGHILVKTILKKGETLGVSGGVEEKRKVEKKVIRVVFSIEDQSDLLVKEGDSVMVGEFIAGMGKSKIREIGGLKKELGYQKYLISKGIGSRKKRNDVLGKIRRIEDEYRRTKVSKFNGIVSKVRMRDVQDGVMKVEVVLEVQEA